MASDAVWAQSELPASDVEAWRDVGAFDPVQIMELIDAGWTPDMAELVVTYRGERATIGRAVSMGMTLDEAELTLAISRLV